MATDINLCMVVGDRHVLEDGTVKWDPAVYSKQSLLTATDINLLSARGELHRQLDEMINMVAADMGRLR